MRLVDADKIYPDCMTKDGKLAISQSQLANVPTVENITVFCESASKEELEDFKKELEKVVRRPQGTWIVTAEDNHGVHRICCPFCHFEKGRENSSIITVTFTKFPNFCEKCGAKLKGGRNND